MGCPDVGASPPGPLSKKEEGEPVVWVGGYEGVSYLS